MTPSAVVVSVGARTPIGLSAIETGFAYRAAAVGMRASPLTAEDGGDGVTMCFLPTIDPRLTGAERAAHLALPALDEALRAAGPALQQMRTRLLLCMDEHLAFAAPGEQPPASALAARVLARAAQSVPQMSLDTSIRGPAGPGFALGSVVEALGRNLVDAAIVGGVHTDYDPARVRALAAAGRLFSTENLDSVLPGELAAFFVIVRPDTARTFKLAPLVHLFPAATAFDKMRPDNDEPAFEAVGLTAAVRKAAAPLTDEKLRAGWLLTDLSFERYRLFELHSMLARTQQIWTEPQQWEAPALRMGALGAAAMPLHVALAAEGWRRGWAAHPVALSCAGSDGGERAALLLAKP